MLTKVSMVGGWFIYSIVGAVALVALMLYAGCTSDTESERPPSGGLGSEPDYYGPATLEEQIAGADAIVRARLVSVSSIAEQTAGETDYIAALDHRFRVSEYLRGSGAGEIVGVVYDTGESFSGSGSAIDRANVLKERRDTQWDDREAIVFLENAHPNLPSTKQADRYRLGAISFARPYNDYYTIASQWGKRWLPAESAGGASGDSGTSGSGEQLFLLDVPTASGASGASGQSASSAPTITLADMKAKIAANDQEIAAGGGSDAYKECLYLKHTWERRVRYMKEHYGPFEDGRDYFYIRYDSATNSGLPAGTRAFTDPEGGEGETAPPGLGDIHITGRDAGLFRAGWPGVVDTVRPLLAGEYRFYYSYRPRESIICDAVPEDELKRLEVFVTATAPTGTLHEARFDPIAIGAAVGADGTNGVLEPAAFTVGGVSTTLQSLKWQGGSVTMELSPAASLTGHALDFIALDGSVSLSLGGGAATVSGGTLTWTVAAQPWQADDKLMLRIHANRGNPSISEVTGTSVGVSWDRVRPSGTYLQDVRVSYRLAGATDWTFGEYVDISTWSQRRQAETVSGLTCGTKYEFQVEPKYSNRWHQYGRISATTGG